MQDPEKFKQLIPSNPQLAQIFSGVDIDALARELRKMDPGMADGGQK